MTSSLEEHYHSRESEETAEGSLLFLFCSNMLNDASTRNRSAEKLETEVNSIRHSMLRKHAAIMFQQRWVWRPKAWGLTSKSMGFEAKKHGVCHPMALRLRLIPHAIISPAITWSAEEERLPKRKSERKYIQTRAHLIFFTINPNRSLGFLCVVRQREIL